MFKKFLFPFIFFISFHNLSAQEIHQITASDYADFLDHIATEEDAKFLFNEKMSSDPLHACIARVGACGSYEYFAIAGRENWPITFVDEQDQIAYVSWLLQDSISNLQSLISNDSSGFKVMSSTAPTLSMEQQASAVPTPTLLKLSKAHNFAFVVSVVAGSCFMIQEIKNFSDNDASSEIEESLTGKRPPTRKPLTPQLASLDAEKTAHQIFLPKKTFKDLAAIATEDDVRKYSPPSSLATVPLSSKDSCDIHEEASKDSNDHSKSTEDELFLAAAIEDLLPSITVVVEQKSELEALDALLVAYNEDQQNLICEMQSLHQRMRSLKQTIDDAIASPVVENFHDVQKQENLLFSLTQEIQTKEQAYQEFYIKIDRAEEQRERVEKEFTSLHNRARFQKVCKRIQIESDPTKEHLAEKFLERYEKKKLEIKQSTSLIF